MKNYLVSLFSALFVVSVAGVANASSVFVDFETGKAPIYDMSDSRYGASQITADPLNPGNNVLSVYGTETAHYMLAADFDSPMSWVGFDLSMDFLATSDSYHPFFGLVGEGGEYSMGTYVHGNPSASSDPVMAFKQKLQGNKTAVTVPLTTDDPTDEWWRLHMWHDTDDDQIKFEIRLSDDTVLSTSSFTPDTDLYALTGIDQLLLGIEETEMQYIDNVRLTSSSTPVPVPASIFFLGSGLIGIMGIRRKLKKSNVIAGRAGRA
ncbi:VPLPA-CTERM sorting domain-containing protein [Desulfonema magnum]|uniref:Ice-binding protein C-terminal domain-containing protein n=1 Tax=Desulfonema magnum TaxID=45655 RepID=A0A975BIM8_9BACT|nr:VPLPA-CTERM sorting domain-containing protein [Desulfonema magnum]QTA86161.1 Uncharacterized protein dnm_021820 [Desulfonema magnum]